MSLEFISDGVTEFIQPWFIWAGIITHTTNLLPALASAITFFTLFHVSCLSTFTKGVFHTVNNGVRQGGILSPLLFNVYINDLSRSLSKLPIGCCSGDKVINHLMYADDIVLLSSSAKGKKKVVFI